MKLQYLRAVPILISFATASVFGSPAGDLDPAFGDHGRILLREPPFEELAGVDVFVDPASGKLTIVADGTYGSARLLRLNSDGSFDQGFGDQGTALLDFGDDDTNISDVEWLPYGKLLIAGALNVFGTPDNVLHGSALLARMRTDGTPDPEFGSEGRAVIQFGGELESVSNILLQPDGSIVALVGTERSGSVEVILARFTENGAPDHSFGNPTTPGFSTIDVAGINASLKSITQQGDGKFLICGEAMSGVRVADQTEILALRINPDGLPDPTFGNRGLVLIGDWQDSVVISTCQELADGHLMFAGSFGSEEWRRAAVWRISPDGRLDAGFGSNGMKVLDTDTPSSAAAMTVMADGALAIAGSQWKPSDKWLGDNNAWLWWSDMLVARLDPTSGAIDQAFGNRGTTAVDLGTGIFRSNAYAASLAQQPDGKLVVVGSQVEHYDWYPWYSIAVARVDPYGSGSNGWASMVEPHVESPAAGGSIELHLRRTGGGTGQLTVDYRTVEGSATAGQDYIETSGTVAWTDGDLSDKTVTVTVLNAELRANAEGFSVELVNSSGGLAMDRATVGIRASDNTGSADPTGSVPPDGVSRKIFQGGGAIGIELWFLSLLVLAFRRFESI